MGFLANMGFTPHVTIILGMTAGVQLREERHSVATLPRIFHKYSFRLLTFFIEWSGPDTSRDCVDEKFTW